MTSKAAKRYARALLDLGIESNKLDEIKEDMILLDQTIEESRDLKLFLRSPLIKKSIKESALKEIFKGKIQQVTMNLIDLLVEKNREKLLHDITLSYISLYKIHHGIIDVEVYTAYELDEKEVKKLTGILESYTGKKVQMDLLVREELLGGLTVRIDDTIINGSVKHKLSQLEKSFTAASVE